MKNKLVNESLNEWFGRKNQEREYVDNSIIEYLINYLNNRDRWMIEDSSEIRPSFDLSIEREGPNKGTQNSKFDTFLVRKNVVWTDGDKLEADPVLVRELYDLCKVKFIEQSDKYEKEMKDNVIDRKQSRRERYRMSEGLNEGFATNEGRKLDTIVGSLGYDDFEEFIGDNPGCFEVITQWLEETFGDELKDRFDQEELESLGIYLEYDEGDGLTGTDEDFED